MTPLLAERAKAVAPQTHLDAKAFLERLSSRRTDQVGLLAHPLLLCVSHPTQKNAELLLLASFACAGKQTPKPLRHSLQPDPNSPLATLQQIAELCEQGSFAVPPVLTIPESRKPKDLSLGGMDHRRPPKHECLI